ncbi:MAG: arsenate reductase ArsC [Hyphomicrobium sp.]
MSAERPFNVLFLCTHNSARSIIAEAVMNRLGMGRFKGYSAGSQPSGKVHPYARDLLAKLNYDTAELRSKTWGEFAAPGAFSDEVGAGSSTENATKQKSGAPHMDFVFTVCDNAANEACPYWPGQPMTAHWGLPDPSAATGTEAERRFAFADTHRMLYQRISIFTALPMASLDKLALQKRLDDIGRTTLNQDSSAAE